jgi:hypothetical protein
MRIRHLAVFVRLERRAMNSSELISARIASCVFPFALISRKPKDTCVFIEAQPMLNKAMTVIRILSNILFIGTSEHDGTFNPDSEQEDKK